MVHWHLDDFQPPAREDEGDEAEEPPCEGNCERRFSADRLQAGIGVVEAMAEGEAHTDIEEHRCKTLGKTVCPLLSESNRKIGTLFQRCEEQGNIRRIILQVAVEGDADVSPCFPKPHCERTALVRVPVEPKTPDTGISGLQFADHLRRAICARIVHDQNLGCLMQAHQSFTELLIKRRQVLGFVVRGDNDGEHGRQNTLRNYLMAGLPFRGGAGRITGPMRPKWLDLAPFIGALLLALVCGYLLGRLITERRSLVVSPMAMRDLSRPPVPTVNLEGVFNGQLKGTMIGEARFFLASKQIVPDQSGAFLVPAGTLLTNQIEITIPAGMRFVASKRGQKYYPVESASASALAPSNRIYFRTAQEAEGAGYRR